MIENDIRFASMYFVNCEWFLNKLGNFNSIDDSRWHGCRCSFISFNAHSKISIYWQMCCRILPRITPDALTDYKGQRRLNERNRSLQKFQWFCCTCVSFWWIMLHAVKCASSDLVSQKLSLIWFNAFAHYSRFDRYIDSEYFTGDNIIFSDR